MTLTETTPGAWMGVLTVSECVEITTNVEEAMVPNLTAVTSPWVVDAVTKCVPEIVMVWDPVVVPVAGATVAMAGFGTL
jgi:hypothetical protein